MARRGVDSPRVLTISQLAERTGVSQPTLRMWEQRHSFPLPHRLPSGHRRYSESDVELVRQVARERAQGVSMRIAVERVLAARDRPVDSIFAGVRRHASCPEPALYNKRSLIGMAHAIEDECLARAERSLLIGSFQREQFYRQASKRWATLCARAELAAVFADFTAVRKPRAGPVELPVDRADPLAREWTVVCRGPEFAALLSAWERPGSSPGGPGRRFEVLWSVDRDLVDDAARIAADLAAPSAPAISAQIIELLQRGPVKPPDVAQLMSLTNRLLAYVSDSSALPVGRGLGLERAHGRALEH